MVNKQFLASVLFVLLVSAFAAADCTKAEPQTSNHAYQITISQGETSGQVDIPIYIEKSANSATCTVTASVEGTPQRYAVTVTPNQISHTGTYYGVYHLTVSASRSADPTAEMITIDIYDQDTGNKMASILVDAVVTSDQEVTTTPNACTKEDTSSCTPQELIALNMGNSIITQNSSDIYLLLGIVAAFAFIVLVFFVIIPRK